MFPFILSLLIFCAMMRIVCSSLCPRLCDVSPLVSCVRLSRVSDRLIMNHLAYLGSTHATTCCCSCPYPVHLLLQCVWYTCTPPFIAESPVASYLRTPCRIIRFVIVWRINTDLSMIRPNRIFHITSCSRIVRLTFPLFVCPLFSGKRNIVCL